METIKNEAGLTKRNKNLIFLFISIIISLIFLYLTFKNIDFNMLLKYKLNINFLSIALILLSYFLLLLFKSIRWFFMLKVIKPVKFMNAFSNVAIGEIGSLILPFRLCDVIRWYLIFKNEGFSRIQVLSLLIIERMFDVLSSLFIFFIGFRFSSLSLDLIPGGIFRTLQHNSIYIALLIAIITLLFIFCRKHIVNLLLTLLDLFFKNKNSNIYNHLRKLILSLDMIKSSGLLMLILFISLLTWVISACCYYSCGYFFGISDKLHLIESMFLNGSVVFAVFLPAAPGNIGTYDYLAKISLNMIGVQNDISLGFIILLRIISTGFFFFISLPFIINEWRNLRNMVIDKENNYDI